MKYLIFLLLIFIPLVDASDNYYTVSENKILSNDYKIILSENIKSDVFIDNNYIYYYTENFFYISYKTNGTIKYKLNIKNIINLVQSTNYIYLNNQKEIYKINKVYGNISEKILLTSTIEKLFTDYPTNLTNCSNCGGNQDLSQVLAVGNDANNQNITNLSMINNVFQVNTSSKAIRLNYNTTDVADPLYTQIFYNSPSTYSLNLIAFRAYGNSSYPYFLFGSANGNETNPLPPLTNKILGNIAAQGYSAGWTGTRANIAYRAAEDWSNTAQGTQMSFYTTSNGSTTLSERMKINDSGKIFMDNLRGDDNSGNAYLCINKVTNEIYVGSPGC